MTVLKEKQPQTNVNCSTSTPTKGDSLDIKCSAISTLDRSTPDTDISQQTEELRNLIMADIKAEPEKFNPDDVKRLETDVWAIQRYLVRCRLNVKSAHKMMKTSLQYRYSPEVNCSNYPAEFYQVGAVFSYERDRRNNVVVYLRVKVNQKIPIVTQYLKSFLFKQIEHADNESNGRGIVICFDMQGAGFGNIDMDFVYYVFNSLVSYFPRAVSYILVHELPWYLRSVWTLAKQMLSDDHRELIKFSDSKTIFEYIEKQNLPDFMGGTCERNYKEVPKNALTIQQASEAWNIPLEDMMDIRRKYAKSLPETDEKLD